MIYFDFYIGEEYKYPNNEKVFKLKKVKGFIFIFQCGHWCTDSVFEDLIRIKNNIQVYTTKKPKQLKLF